MTDGRTLRWASGLLAIPLREGMSRMVDVNSRVSRRVALQTTAAGLAGAMVAGVRRAQGADEPVSAIDAHTHFYDPSRPQGVPWPGKGDKVLYRPVLPKELAELAAPQHVGATIVVEASPLVEDNQWLIDLAAREPFIIGVVGNLDPASEEFPKLIKRFAEAPIFRGIRIGHGALVKGLDQPAFLKNLQLLADADRQLDVNGGPDMPADVARLSRALPDLRIVINHAGNLRIDGKAVPSGWLEGMRAAASRERVYCKVSALVESTGKQNRDAPTDLEFYRPVLDALWETWGENRMIYGSNWPVSDRFASYATVYGIVHDYFKSRGATALKKYLRENAIPAYKPVLKAK